MLLYNHRKGRKTLQTRKGEKMKYEVKFNNWEGEWEDTYFVGTEAECEAWISENSGDLNGEDEYYSLRIHG